MEPRDLRQGIDELFAAYAECLDEDRLEAWPDFFTDPCKYLITSRADHARGLPHGVVYAASRAMLVDRVTALREANIFEPHHYRHILGPARIAATADGISEVRSNFMVLRIMHDGDTQIFGSGRYLDLIDVSAAGFRFSERVVVLDSRKIDTLLAIPL
jgi:anthranilate 1,2-dioxygenase small subunit